MRLTRAESQELVELHGIKSAVEWIGNSAAVARKHYLQTTESDFLRAIRTDVGSDVGSDAKSDAKSDAMTVSQSLEAARTEPKPKTSEKPLVLQGESKLCDSVPVTQVPRAGLEEVAVSHWKTALSESGDAESDATDARNAQIRWLVERWDSLPDDVRDEIMRLVEAPGFWCDN